MHESLIDTIQYYISLSESDQPLVRTLFREQSLNKGAYFLKEGQVCRYLGFIHTGLIRYYNNKDGEEVISEFGKEGNFVCNYESFLVVLIHWFMPGCFYRRQVPDLSRCGRGRVWHSRTNQ